MMSPYKMKTCDDSEMCWIPEDKINSLRQSVRCKNMDAVKQYKMEKNKWVRHLKDTNVEFTTAVLQNNIATRSRNREP